MSYVHLRFFLSFSSFSSASAFPTAALPARLGNLGDTMNVLSAPRLTEAMTRLFKLSLCFLLSFSTPLEIPVIDYTNRSETQED